MRKQAVRDDDPGKSLWWLAPPFLCSVVGFVMPVLTGLGGSKAPLFGGFVGFLLGAAADFTPQIRTWVEARSSAKRFAHRHGALGLVNECSLTDLGVRSSDPDSSTFIFRDQCEDAKGHLDASRAVLIHGAPLVGKTRLAAEVVKTHWGDRPLFAPDDPSLLKEFFDSSYSLERGTVVFLDRIDRLLPALTSRRITHWRDTGCLIVATIENSELTRITGGDGDAVYLLEGFTRVPLGKHSEPELQAIRQSVHYRDLAEQARQWGLPVVLAVKPVLRTRLETAAGEQRPGWAVIRAAIDWHRAGLGAANETCLQQMAGTYIESVGRRPDWQAEWAWATKKVRGGVALLMHSGDLWLAPELVSDLVHESIPDEALAAMSHASLTGTQCVALSVYLRNRENLTRWSTTIELLQERAKGSAEGVAALVREQAQSRGAITLRSSEEVDSGAEHAPETIQTRYDFAVALRNLYDDQGISLQELAQASRSDTTALSDWFTGLRLPRVTELPLLNRLLEELGVGTENERNAWDSAFYRAATHELLTSGSSNPFRGFEDADDNEDSEFYG